MASAAPPRADQKKVYDWETQPEYIAACCVQWPGMPIAYGKLSQSLILHVVLQNRADRADNFHQTHLVKSDIIQLTSRASRPGNGIGVPTTCRTSFMRCCPRRVMHGRSFASGRFLSCVIRRGRLLLRDGLCLGRRRGS